MSSEDRHLSLTNSTLTGYSVEFEVVQCPKGPQAANVRKRGLSKYSCTAPHTFQITSLLETAKWDINWFPAQCFVTR